MSAIKAEIQWLKSLIYSKECNTLSVQDCGTRFAYQKVLCHNDLLSGNILLHDTSATANEDNTPIISEDITSSTPSTNQRSCSLIDFEYSFYNYRAYDLANHFCGKNWLYSLLIFITHLHYLSLSITIIIMLKRTQWF